MKSSPEFKDLLRIYNIPLKGLKQGIHQFDYQIDGQFFTNFENAPLQQSKLTVSLNIDKRVNLFVLQFDIQGTVYVSCDRCAEFFDCPLESNNMIFLKVSYDNQKTVEEDTDTDVLYISTDTNLYNVAQLIYEFIVLNMSIQNMHPLDENGVPLCDPKVIDILNYGLASEEAKDETEDVDPRWAALKKLKDKK